MSREINRMAKRLQDLPDHAVAAVETVIQGFSNLRYLDKEDGVEIERPPELVESLKYYCDRLEQLLIDQRMSAAWDTMDQIAEGKYEYQSSTQSSYCLVNFVIELSKMSKWRLSWDPESEDELIPKQPMHRGPNPYTQKMRVI